MTKRKIYLQFPLRKSECSYYKYLVEDTPKEYLYINSEKSKGIIESKNKKKNFDFVKKFSRNLVRKLKLPLPNAHITITNKKYDLIHCAHCLSLNKKPWVCDIEFIGQFWVGGFSRNFPSKKRVLKILKSPYCKKILAWTRWAAKKIIKEFPEIKNKVEVVYPAIPIQKFKKIKSSKIRLLFVSRKFYFKGGLYALEVMDKLTKKYDNVEGIIVSDVPREILRKYSKNKKIDFLGMVPQKKLFEDIYPLCDIFVYPSFTDTFGFAIIEAMSFGLPVISAKGRSRKELIEDGKTGFIIETNLADIVEDSFLKSINKGVVVRLSEKVNELIMNNELLKKMSRNCINEIKNGKFSIKTRNNQLKRIYEETIK